MLIAHELSGGAVIHRLVVDGNKVEGEVSDFLKTQKAKLPESTWENFLNYYAGCKANVATVGEGNGVRIFLSEEAEKKAVEPAEKASRKKAEVVAD